MRIERVKIVLNHGAYLVHLFFDLRNPAALSERLPLDVVVDFIRFFQVTKRATLSSSKIISVLLKVLAVQGTENADTAPEQINHPLSNSFGYEWVRFGRFEQTL